MIVAPTFNSNILELNKTYRGKRECVSYCHSIILAFKGQKILGMSQDQHNPAPREIHLSGKAASSGEREGERKGGEVGGGKLELGKGAKRRAKPFSISQRDYKGPRAAELRLLSSSGFYHCWGILAGRERESERPRGYLRLQRRLCVTPCSSFISSLDRGKREKRETPTSKDSLISEVHRSTT